MAEGNPQPGADGAGEARLARLEESIGFAEHALGQLSDEVRLLNQRLRDLGKKINSLEARLAAERQPKDVPGPDDESGGTAPDSAAPA
jgi:uncharacterized coiled-coil protein SlyX